MKFQDIIEDIAISNILNVPIKEYHQKVYDMLSLLFGTLPEKKICVRYNQIYRIAYFKYDINKKILYINKRDINTDNEIFELLLSTKGYIIIFDYISHTHQIDVTLDYLHHDSKDIILKIIDL